MGVTQYVGARYVPLFADPEDWTPTRTYEPLTIVLHEGNSFTSKQFVPKGIQIDNKNFWAETGNYNAQVEAYRQEVLSFDDRITTTEHDLEGIKNFATPEKYGAVGNGVADDTAAVKQCIAENDIVLLNGKYAVSENIEIANTLAPNQKPKTIINNGELILNDAYIHIYGEMVRLTGGVVRGSGLNTLVYLGQTPEKQNTSAIKCTIEDVYFVSTNNVPAITMLNYYKGNFGCYCNTIKNVYAYNCTRAIGMVGDVNANNITDVIMWSNIEGIEGMIVLEGIRFNDKDYGPKENNFSQLFYYRGVNTPTVLYKNNCGNGSYRNSFANCTTEQGGNNSHFLEVENDVTAGRNIYAGITTNLYGGDFSAATKKKMLANKDTYIGSSNTFFSVNVLANGNVDTTGYISTKKNYSDNFTKRQVENTEAVLLQTGNRTAAGIDPMLHGGYLKVIVSEFYLNVSRLQHTEEILLNVLNNGILQIAQQAENSRFSINNNTLLYRTGNNGTSLNAYITCSYEVCAFDDNAIATVSIPE